MAAVGPMVVVRLTAAARTAAGQAAITAEGDGRSRILGPSHLGLCRWADRLHG
jgi:hypothetical protein